MIDLDTTDLQCIRRALTDFIRSKENSTYSFPYYSELNARINNAITTLTSLSKKQEEEIKVKQKETVAELNARINNAIYSEENNKLQDKENGEMKI